MGGGQKSRKIDDVFYERPQSNVCLKLKVDSKMHKMYKGQRNALFLEGMIFTFYFFFSQSSEEVALIY